MEDTVKLKWYFRLFSKLDNEACNVDMTNRAVAWGIDYCISYCHILYGFN